MSGLVLTIRKFNDDKGRVRFDWNLRSNGQIVSTSHRQGYSRRIDCTHGAEVGTGLHDVQNIVAGNFVSTHAWRWTYKTDLEYAEVRLVDERPEPFVATIEPPYYRNKIDGWWHDHEYHYRNCSYSIHEEPCTEGTPPVGEEVRGRFGPVTFSERATP